MNTAAAHTEGGKEVAKKWYTGGACENTNITIKRHSTNIIHAWRHSGLYTADEGVRMWPKHSAIKLLLTLLRAYYVYA